MPTVDTSGIRTRRNDRFQMESTRPTATLAPGTRLHALDILRGLVIVIMALDHIRDYTHDSGWAYDALDFRATSLIVYLTRWITHFCAPTFVFLAGVSIWLQAAKGKDRARLSGFLVKRGLWLVVLEVTVISFGWSFAIPYIPFLQVIWGIGVSMIAMAVLVWLPRRVVLALGVSIVIFHNLLDPIQAKTLGSIGPVWMILHEGGVLTRDGRPVALAFYPLMPWLGVMTLGYGLGFVFLSPNRDRLLLRLGLGMLALFATLRGLHGYGDPLPWAGQATLLQTAMNFFNVQKYPPSLLYVCATLGPALLLARFLSRCSPTTLDGPLAQFFRTFGAVPMMAYLAHLYIMHILAFAMHAVAGHPVEGMTSTMANFFFRPDVFKGIGFPLPVVFLAWAAIIALVFPICRWWADVKRRRSDWWLSYL